MENLEQNQKSGARCALATQDYSIGAFFIDVCVCVRGHVGSKSSYVFQISDLTLCLECTGRFALILH
jgi:hypothetical protein